MIKVAGTNRKHKNLKSDEFHFVLTGSGTYTEAQDRTEVSPGDLVHIPKGQVYENDGQMTLLVFSSPAYDKNEIEYED